MGAIDHGRILEAQIALICARASLTPERRARLGELLTHRVDWSRLLALADRHGVLPLVSHHLTQSVAAAVPSAIGEELLTRTRAIAGRNLLMTSELIRVVRRLEACGIPALPYKGPVLAMTAYERLGLRSFDDLDLLIPPSRVRESIRIMIEDGYHPVYRLTPAQEAAYLRTQCEYIVERDDVRVELHWQIVPRYFGWPFDGDRLRSRATSTSLAGATLRTMSLEDLVLVLCAHGSKHCWDRLEWVASLAEIVRRYPAIDWREIDDQARRAGARRMLDVSLSLIRDVMQDELPPAVSRHADRDPTARALAGEVGRRFHSGDLGVLDRPQEVRFHLRSRERLADRLRYVARLGTTQTLGDWDLASLPRGLDAFYRVIRPVRLLGKFGPTVVMRSLRALTGASRAGDPRSGPPR
ncbi:MAG: nucleotidyltransferase domain-containing protein [Gammaproteobacteria bacterium]